MANKTDFNRESTNPAYLMAVELYETWVQDPYKANKYDRAGIYCIYINNSLVYVGQSENMLFRLASHMANTNYLTENKYKVLGQAEQEGYKIGFGVLEYCSQSELKVAEAKYIGQLRPVLNYQIPNADGSGWHCNRAAKTVKLKDIVK